MRWELCWASSSADRRQDADAAAKLAVAKSISATAYAEEGCDCCLLLVEVKSSQHIGCMHDIRR